MIKTSNSTKTLFVTVKNTIKWISNNKTKNIESLFKIVLFLRHEITILNFRLINQVHCNYAKQKTYSCKSNANHVCL
jgi:hypothetical protein